MKAQPRNLNRKEVSVVIPCLNEAETVATCVEKALSALHDEKIDGEVIVADNGSTDGSQGIASRAGARVIHVRERRYGFALMQGIAAASGEFIIMGDANDSYDFLEVPRFVAKLREGFDLVQGCRLPSGGGSNGYVTGSRRFGRRSTMSWVTAAGPVQGRRC